VHGGIHTTILPEQCTRRYPETIAVIGEGEITMGELLDELGKDNPQLDSVDGIAYMKDGKYVETNPRALITDLDILPFPKHELFFDKKRDFGCLLTSRGCPFRCSFCALDSVSRQKHRVRSVKNVADEIGHMIKSFPQMKRIWIHDDTFFMNNQRVMDLCDEIAKRKYNHIEFVASGRVKPLSAKLIKKLEKANFTDILLGLETGSVEVLKRTHKHITQEDVINAFELFKDSPIRISTFLIVGLPGETKDTLLETAAFVKKIQKIKYTYFDNIGVLQIYPGTEVCTFAENAGQIDRDYWLSNKPIPLYTVEHDMNTLYEYKQLLLDHISLFRMTTPRGFVNQIDMIPHIAKYIWSNRNKVFAKIANTIIPGRHTNKV
jgi:radical SAM superfamily enzyme YgiQ (UPF0313 family)